MQKSNKKTVFILLFVFLLMGVFMLSHQFNVSSDYQEIKTDSGLKVLFLKDDSLPFIQYRIFFPKAGADYDSKGKNGLATITAYLMEQGAGGLGSEVLQEELNQLGTEFEIQVSRQTASLALSGLSWHGEKLWGIFQKVLSEPHFKKEEMELLRKQLLEQRLQGLDQPGFVANSLIRQRLFKGSIGQPRGGTLTSLSKISLEDIKSFYKNQYIKGEPVLMIVGQYDRKLKDQIISFFNESFAFQNQKFEPVAAPDLKPEFKLIANDDLVQAEVRLAYSLNSFPVNRPKNFLALKLANAVLGRGSMTSRLFVGLREERGLTYAVWSSFSLGKLYGIFELSGSTKTASVKEFLEQSLAILKKFKEEGISPEELNQAKQNLKSRYLKSIETPENQLNQFVYYTHYLGLDPYFWNNYLDIVDNLALDEVNALIKKFILSKPLQVLIYGHSSLRDQLEGLEAFAPPQMISFKDTFKEELNSYQKQ